MRLIALLFGLVCAGLAFAEAPIITLPAEGGERRVSGVVHGFNVVSYGVEARAGQSLGYRFAEGTSGVLANIWPPGGTEAASIGSTRSREGSTMTSVSGVYQVDIIQPVAFARRGATAAYDLTILVAAPPAPAKSAAAEQENGRGAQVPVPDIAANVPRPVATDSQTAPARERNDLRDGLAHNEPVAGAAASEPSGAVRAPRGMARPKLRPVRARVVGVSTMLNVRGHPSADASIVGTLANGAELLLRECSMGIERRWCKIETSAGVFGWVVDQFLSEISGDYSAATR